MLNENEIEYKVWIRVLETNECEFGDALFAEPMRFFVIDERCMFDRVYEPSIGRSVYLGEQNLESFIRDSMGSNRHIDSTQPNGAVIGKPRFLFVLKANGEQPEIISDVKATVWFIRKTILSDVSDQLKINPDLVDNTLRDFPVGHFDDDTLLGSQAGARRLPIVSAST